jgi:hypothetical protein
MENHLRVLLRMYDMIHPESKMSNKKKKLSITKKKNAIREYFGGSTT